MPPEICQMPVEDHIHPEWDRLENEISELERSMAAQNVIVSKLVLVSENTNSSLQRLEGWVRSHEADYRAVRERLLSQEIIGNNISQRLDKVTSAFESVSTKYMNDRSRFLGAWAAAGSAGAFILGALAVLKAFGFLG